MTTLYLKTAQLSIASAAILMLCTAAPAFAAKKGALQFEYYAPHSTATSNQSSAAASQSYATTTDATSTPPTDLAQQSTTEDATSTSMATSDPAIGSNDTPPAQPADTAPPAAQASPLHSTIITAVESAVNAAKTKIFPKQTAAGPTTTPSGAGATTGIASLFQGSATGGIYASGKFDESDTYKLLALALALAAAGLFLTNTSVFTRTYRDLSRAVAVGRSPEATRSRA